MNYSLFMDINQLFFNKINALVGKNKILDAFGRAGAEWVIFIMFAWFFLSGFLFPLTTTWQFFQPVLTFFVVWLIGWGSDILIGMYIREGRPHLTDPNKKILFTPLMSWKSFPSDHAMTAFLIFMVAMIFQLPLFWGLLPLALWVCWGRVYAGLHYPIDIAGGFSMALILSVILYNLLLI